MWGWGRPRRDIPQVNYEESEESEEENFADGLVFNSPLTSPQRPLHTREGSPVDTVEGGPTLADNVDDTLEEVQFKLHDIAVVREEIEEVTDLLEDTDTRVAGDKLEVKEEVLEFNFKVQADTEVGEENIAAQDVVEPAIMVFETENGTDDANALREALRNLERLQYDGNDLKFFFGQAEIKMASSGVKKQFTKFQVLSSILPKEVIDEVKPLLSKTEAEFTQNDSYKQLKARVLKIFGPRPEDAVERALSRVLTGKPSTLARQLKNDLCKHDLENCECCPAIITALWKRQLGANVKAGIAHLKLSNENFDEVLQLADDIFSSNTPATHSVAAIRSEVVPSTPSALNETQPGLSYPVPEVNAVRYNRGGCSNRGGRGRGSRGRGSQAGGNQASSSGSSGPSRGPKHPDLPPGEWSGCNMHRKFGRGAYFCAEPATCPWKNIYAVKPSNK